VIVQLEQIHNFCHYNTCDVKQVIKGFCDINRILSCHSINNEKNFGRVNTVFDVDKLCHKLLVNMQTACGIYNNHVIAVLFSMLNTRLGNLDRGYLSTH
jgi:hypothetical protein